MNDNSPLSGEWLVAWERSMMIEEEKDMERFHDFYASIPKLVIRDKTHVSHVPLKFVTNEHNEGR